MTIETISAEQYATERAVCDKAEAYWQRVTGGKRNYITAEEAQHPDYRACDNAMRGRAEQYELVHDTPERFVAYIQSGNRNGMGCDGVLGQSFNVTTWTGDKIGRATKGSTWRVNSFMGTHMSQFYATINGREFTGRSFGEGMCINLRETAASKRKRGA